MDSINEFEGGNPVLEAVMVNALLECFEAIEAFSWQAIEALGGADCDPLAPVEERRLTPVDVGCLIEMRNTIEAVSAVLSIVLGRRAPTLWRSDLVKEMEGILRYLADEGGLLKACGQIRSCHG